MSSNLQNRCLYVCATFLTYILYKNLGKVEDILKKKKNAKLIKSILHCLFLHLVYLQLDWLLFVLKKVLTHPLHKYLFVKLITTQKLILLIQVFSMYFESSTVLWPSASFILALR